MPFGLGDSKEDEEKDTERTKKPLRASSLKCNWDLFEDSSTRTNFAFQL